MYDELVKRLRSVTDGSHEDKCDGCPYDEDYPCCADCLDTMFKQAADAIEELGTLLDGVRADNDALCETIERLKNPRWIPVTERLPEDGTQNLVMRFDYVTNTPFYDLLWFDKGEWWNRNFKGNYAVTHWLPLPEPPKEEVEQETMTEYFKVNLNDTVKVRLTDLGKDIYYHQYDNLNRQAGRTICKPKFPDVDEEGYTSFQLWDFIRLYGDYIGMARPNVIEPLDIVCPTHGHGDPPGEPGPRGPIELPKEGE